MNLSSAIASCQPAVTNDVVMADGTQTWPTVETDASLLRAVDELNRFAEGRRPDVRFVVGPVTTHRDRVLIVDAVSEHPLREMPSAEALRVARYLEHERLGLIRQRG